MRLVGESPRPKTGHPPPRLARELWKKPALRRLLLALLQARPARPEAESCPADLVCYPGIPYHRHLLWKVALYSGARLVPYHEVKRRDRARPRLRVCWPDTTAAPGGVPPEPPPPDAWFEGALNAGARDESKAMVASTFAQAFGYPLAVDPRHHRGPCVAKSNQLNGAHDGRVVHCPIAAAEPGLAYQVLVDNRAGPGMVLDYRVPVVAGEIPFVYVKQRPIEARFGNANAAVDVVASGEVFSAAEQGRLRAFARGMGLALGGELDVLRDAGSGRIYVVDANWTSWGPPRPIATAAAVAAVRAYAAALARLLARAG